MFVIKKKNILIAIVCVFISIVLVELINLTSRNINTVETVALPVNKKIIILDAGHRSEKMEVLQQKMV